MKLLCDECAAAAATVFCSNDEAALCDACDRRVHRANKLAGKHQRFFLLHPAPSSSSSSSAQKPPLCDICQDRRGLFFCKEDRAIFCRECDVATHNANELTRRHSRFLLTGVRVSSEPVDFAAVPEKEVVEVEPENSGSSARNASSSSGAAAAGAATASASDGSSISEYLTKTLPGWHVEDFLVDDADAGVAACSDGLDQGGKVQIGGLLQEAFPVWAGPEQVLSDVVVTADEQASRERCVPQMQMQMHPEWTGSKRPRASAPCSYW